MAARTSILDVAVVQMWAARGDVAGNTDRLVRSLRAHCAGADLVVAPELVTTGYDLDLIDERGHALAEPMDGPTVSQVADVAADLEMTVVFGLLERDHDLLYDTVAVVTPERKVSSARKSHLYPAERGRFASGNGLAPIDTPAAGSDPSSASSMRSLRSPRPWHSAVRRFW